MKRFSLSLIRMVFGMCLLTFEYFPSSNSLLKMCHGTLCVCFQRSHHYFFNVLLHFIRITTTQINPMPRSIIRISFIEAFPHPSGANPCSRIVMMNELTATKCRLARMCISSSANRRRMKDVLVRAVMP